jgi:YHS domain-containing protein
LMKELAEGHPRCDELWKSERDPVCGMMVSPEFQTANVAGQPFRFCSELCRNQFLREPVRYRRGVDP